MMSPALRGCLMRVCLILGAMALASCASETQYIRADGRYASAGGIKEALAECSSESKDDLCMVEKGYLKVSAEQAEAKRTQLAAIAEANEQARLAKAKEEERQAKAKEQEKQVTAKKKKQRAKLTARTTERPRKQAIDAKRGSQPVDSPTPVGSPWSNTPTFSPVAPARQ